MVSDVFDDFNNDEHDTNDSIDGDIENVLSTILDPSMLVQYDNCDNENEEEYYAVSDNETAEIIVGKKREIIRIKFSKKNKDCWKDIFKLGHDLMIKTKIDVSKIRGAQRSKRKLLFRKESCNLVASTSTIELATKKSFD